MRKRSAASTERNDVRIQLLRDVGFVIGDFRQALSPLDATAAQSHRVNVMNADNQWMSVEPLVPLDHIDAGAKWEAGPLAKFRPDFLALVADVDDIARLWRRDPSSFDAEGNYQGVPAVEKTIEKLLNEIGCDQEAAVALMPSEPKRRQVMVSKPDQAPDTPGPITRFMGL